MEDNIEKTKKEWLKWGRIVIPGSKCNTRPSSIYHPEDYHDYYNISDTIDPNDIGRNSQELINCFDENVLVVAKEEENEGEKRKFLVFKRLSEREEVKIQVFNGESCQKDNVLKLFQDIKLIIMPSHLHNIVYMLEKLGVDFSDLIWDTVNGKQKVIIFLGKQLGIRYSETEEYKKQRTPKEKSECCTRLLIEEFKRQRMKSFLDSRGIKYLVHFTRLENKESIKEDGLLSLAAARRKGICIKQHDGSNPEHVYLSIEFPNYSMFYKKRIESQGEWIVVLLDAYAILSELKCSFSNDNSARHDIIGDNGYEALDNGSYSQLVNLFNETNRSALCKNNWTTNHQAEVIVEDYVPPKYVEKFIEKSEDNRYFSCRADYQKA